jgi:hypothetical protein
MSDKSKEQLVEELKQIRLRRWGRDKPLPSETFVKENSRSERRVDTPSSEIVLSSVSVELTPQEMPTLPEKSRIQICEFCSKRFAGSRFTHILACPGYNNSSEPEPKQKAEPQTDLYITDQEAIDVDLTGSSEESEE